MKGSYRNAERFLSEPDALAGPTRRLASGRTGLAKSDSAPNSIHFAAPLQFGGLEGRWTPEDLLLCAVAGCFTTPFRVLAENSKWEYTDLEVEAAGKVDKANSGYSFSHIILKPHLQIIGEGERARAFELLQKAEICA